MKEKKKISNSVPSWNAVTGSSAFSYCSISA